MRFPLPKDAFKPMDVSAKQQQAYESHVQRLIAEALSEYERFEALGSDLYKQPWKTTARSSQMRVVRMKDAVLPMRAHYRVFGAIEGDLRHMIEFMYAETTKDFMEWQQIMFPTVVDAHVLATFKTATTDKPHDCMGIRWIACQPVPWERIFTSYVESVSYVQSAQGDTIGVRVNIPIDVPQLSVLMDAMKVKRFDHTVVQLLCPSRERQGETNIFNVIQHDHPSYVPFVFDRSLLSMAEKMAAFATARRIVRTPLVPEAQWTPNHMRRSCAVCRRAFGAMRKRHHCRMCGDVICRTCVVQSDAPQYTSPDAFRMRKTKFCVLCMTAVRERPPEAGPIELPAHLQHHSSSSSSLHSSLTAETTEVANSSDPGAASLRRRDSHGHSHHDYIRDLFELRSLPPHQSAPLAMAVPMDEPSPMHAEASMSPHYSIARTRQGSLGMLMRSRSCSSSPVRNSGWRDPEPEPSRNSEEMLLELLRSTKHDDDDDLDLFSSQLSMKYSNRDSASAVPR